MLRVIALLLLHRFVFAKETLVTSVGCGTTKGCFKNPPKCSGVDECDVIVTWAPATGSESLITFEIVGKMNPDQAYVGIGFSHDKYMGDDDVWSCVQYRDEVLLDHSINNGLHNDALELKSGTVTNFTGAVVDSVMQCRFTLIRSIVIEEGALKNMTFNLCDGYYIFIVRAFAMKRAGAIYLAKHRVLPIISANKMDFNSVAVETSVAKRPILLKCHAVTMLAGWVCCASIAIFFAKYFKGSWPNSTLCGHKVWFAMHGFLMLTNVICTVAGFVTVFIYVGGFVHYKKMYQPIFVHTCCGIAATALSLITSVMALFRPHTGTEKRPYFNWAHWFLGISSFILAIACVFTGIDLEMLDLPEYTFWIMVGYVLLNAVTYILLKLVIGVAENGVARKQGEHYELQDRTGPIGSRNQLVGDVKVTPPSSRMAIFLLGLLSVGVVGITVALTCITASM